MGRQIGVEWWPTFGSGALGDSFWRVDNIMTYSSETDHRTETYPRIADHRTEICLRLADHGIETYPRSISMLPNQIQ